MTNTRIVETAIDENGNPYIYSDKQQAGFKMPGHIITDLFLVNNIHQICLNLMTA